MPKEITHWIAAERIRTFIEPGTVQDAINKHPLFYYLGAVIFDSPFYAFGVKNTDSFKAAAQRLHGVDNGDTFEPFRAFFSSYHGTPPEEALSFISGAFTHYGMDVTFHPMVNFFSGKYASDDPGKRIEAQVRHRTIESLMDLYFSGVHADESGCASPGNLGSCIPARGRFSRIVKGLSNSNEKVDEIVGRLYRVDTAAMPIRPLLNRHGSIQRLFFSPLLSAGLNLTGRVVGGPLEIIATTFYPAARSRALRTPSKTLKFFSSSISFTHPNTGEAVYGTANDLAARAAATAADLINGYQDFVKRGKGANYLEEKQGLSLTYGCDTTKYPEQVYFDTDTPIQKLCYTPCHTM